METYANPNVLVSTEWLARHLNDPNAAIVEVDVDTAAYEEGHIPGAIRGKWQTELGDTLKREIIGRK